MTTKSGRHVQFLAFIFLCTIIYIIIIMINIASLFRFASFYLVRMSWRSEVRAKIAIISLATVMSNWHWKLKTSKFDINLLKPETKVCFGFSFRVLISLRMIDPLPTRLFVWVLCCKLQPELQTAKASLDQNFVTKSCKRPFTCISIF